MPIDRLPVLGSDDPKIRELPIEWGDVIKDEPLWRRVKLPDGWRGETTKLPQWQNIIDPEGVVRAAVFFGEVPGELGKTELQAKIFADRSF